jgi:ABC-type sugar transport system ATPase subunit
MEFAIVLYVIHLFLYVGTPLNIYNEPANEFVASFIGSPSMNINDGEVNNLLYTSFI